MKARREVAQKHIEWTEKQKLLLDLGLSKSEVLALGRAEKLTIMLDKLKKHGGPLTSHSTKKNSEN